ncbi:MAG: hypothetical protein M0Q23_05240 [Syntrophales bacterium]|jgi:hypothetical protein|nr:hypothetical protein [Syntrophales bacterium]MCK9528046.1 hypothetical protein [Syntrophales bacterium]MDX9922359.1 hypothetical protein [Syntrophales bacterium]
MLYIERDKKGTIVAIYNAPNDMATEKKNSVDEEVLDFLSETAGEDSKKLLLSISDKGMIRLIEDLVDLLIRKNIILFTELPDEAQTKMQERSKLRGEIASHSLTVDDII